MFWSLYVVTCPFNVSVLIYMPWKSPLEAWRLPLNWLNTIKASNGYFNSLSIFLSFVNIWKKDMKKLLTFGLQLGEDSSVSGIAK